MKSISRVALVAMAAMTVLSFTNLLGVSIAGISVLVGVAFFFVCNVQERRLTTEAGLDLGALKENLKDRSLWLWLALPTIMDALSIGIALLVMPHYIEHVLRRASAFITIDQWVPLVLQLIVLALGEEIAWRAFLLNRARRVMSIPTALLASSVLFALGHMASGPLTIVAYDLFFVFVNSVLYGVIFLKSKNAWASTLSHFVANLFSIIVFMVIR